MGPGVGGKDAGEDAVEGSLEDTARVPLFKATGKEDATKTGSKNMKASSPFAVDKHHVGGSAKILVMSKDCAGHADMHCQRVARHTARTNWAT